MIMNYQYRTHSAIHPICKLYLNTIQMHECFGNICIYVTFGRSLQSSIRNILLALVIGDVRRHVNLCQTGDYYCIYFLHPQMTYDFIISCSDANKWPLSNRLPQSHEILVLVSKKMPNYAVVSHNSIVLLDLAYDQRCVNGQTIACCLFGDKHKIS